MLLHGHLHLLMQAEWVYYCGLCWCFPLKFSSWFLPIWRRFFRQGLQAALHHLRMGCVCSSWNLLVYLTGQTFFPVKKWVLKKKFIWIQPHFVWSSILFDWRNRLFSLEFFWSLILVVPDFMWISFFSALLQALFVLPFRFPVKKNTKKLKLKPIMPPIRGSWTVWSPSPDRSTFLRTSSKVHETP